MALGIMLVLTVVLTTVIALTAANARDSKRVSASQKAYSLAESGVSDALAVLNANYPQNAVPYPGPRCLLGAKAAPANFPGTEPLGSYICGVSVPQTFTTKPDPARPNETSTWWGRVRVVTGLGLAWVIQSTGSVTNPTGPNASPVTRTIYAKVPVVIGTTSDSPPNVLNWLYSVKDATIGQAVDLQSPFYVRGNLTMTSTSKISAPLYVTCVTPPAAVPTAASPCPSTAGNVSMSNQAKMLSPATVAIGGALTENSSQNTVGTNAVRLSEAHIVNGCYPNLAGNPYHNPCQWDTDSVFVAPATRDAVMPVDPVASPPVIDYNFWYQFASPGPQFACDAATQVGTPPVFENEPLASATLNVSVPGIVNLTPGTTSASDYDCKTLGGEIKWTTATKTLFIKGTIFIDGSAQIASQFPGQTPLQYQGVGTIYLAGTFLLKNTAMCVVLNGNNCDTAANVWDPNKNALIIVAKSRGSDLPVSQQSASGNDSIEVTSSQFQGALIGRYDITSTTTSVVQGPLVSTDSSISLSQTTGASFPDIHFAPSGAPGLPPPPSVLLAPRQFGGG
jgi:hypothetical protein